MCLNSFVLSSNELRKTSIQFMWLDQFEFAGFYMAKEKGFYKELNLDVEFKKFDSQINLVDEVINGNSDFALNSSSLLIDKSKGKDIVILGAIFQSSPFVLLSLKQSNINSLDEIKNKRIMISNNQEKFITLQSMLKSQGLDTQKLNFIPHSFNVDDLINKKADLMSAYITNEPFILKEKGFESKIFYPKDYGFDFYENIIFTSENFIKNNPKLVKDFYDATIKGWHYAFDNIQESVRIIHKKYNPQNKSLDSLIYEANELKKLAFDKNKEIGTIDENRINLIYNLYKVMGLINSNIDLKELIYQRNFNNLNLTQNEFYYLKNKNFISMCVDPSWMPFEKIEKGEHIGMASDYMKIIETKLNKEIRLIPTSSWTQSLDYVKDRKCDILSLAMSTKERENYLNFSNAYLKTPLVIATNLNTPFIENLNQIKNMNIGIIKDYAFGEILKNKYPNLNFIEVIDVEDGLKKVANETIDGFIDTLSTTAYHIQKQYIGQIKISGKFEESLNLSIASRNDEPLLNEIFNKVIDDIPQITKDKIFSQWVEINLHKEIDYKFLLNFLFLSILVVLIFLLIYRHNLLKRLNKQLDEKIAFEIAKNEEKNKILIKQSRMASMGEILENIAHQWRQPLSTILVVTTGMEVKKELNLLDDKELLESIAHIKNSVNYLSNTIDDFRSFLNEDKPKKEFSIESLIDKSLELMGTKYCKEKINYVKHIDNLNLVSLENELLQVILNILSNARDALKFSTRNKLIIINAYRSENRVIISIKDSAGGINENIIDKIFEPYFTTKHKYKGTGIGLYMSKLLVEKHLDGSLEVQNSSFAFENENYEGAEFKISLPL